MIVITTTNLCAIDSWKFPKIIFINNII